MTILNERNNQTLKKVGQRQLGVADRLLKIVQTSAANVTQEDWDSLPRSNTKNIEDELEGRF